MPERLSDLDHGQGVSICVYIYIYIFLYAYTCIWYPPLELRKTISFWAVLVGLRASREVSMFVLS